MLAVVIVAMRDNRSREEDIGQDREDNGLHNCHEHFKAVERQGQKVREQVSHYHQDHFTTEDVTEHSEGERYKTAEF